MAVEAWQREGVRVPAMADTSLAGLRVLGQGRYGRVYLSQMDKGQFCAVKAVANTAAARAEIECMQAVAGHPGVVRLFKYDAGNLDAGMKWIVLIISSLKKPEKQCRWKHIYIYIYI